jgi:hypothetical protein
MSADEQTEKAAVAISEPGGSPWGTPSSLAPDVRLIKHRRGQPMRSARDTMIPSGPRTYAMRQMCSYWPMPPISP